MMSMAFLPRQFIIEPLQTMLIIRPLQQGDSFEKMTSVLHLSYNRLAETGLRFLATHQDSSQHASDACQVILYWLVKPPHVATITLYTASLTSHNTYYRRPDVRHCGQFAFLLGFQKYGIGNIMMDLAEKIASHNGAKELVLDTSEQALHLID